MITVSVTVMKNKMKYKNIKWILNQQAKMDSPKRWVFLQDTNEFICVFDIIPPEAEQLYTPQQLLNKLNSL